jgi:hypothetical protein
MWRARALNAARKRKVKDIMATNIATAASSAASIPAPVQAAGGREYSDEEVRGLVAALEEPFDPQEIKWRVTNTTKDRARGQVVHTRIRVRIQTG